VELEAGADTIAIVRNHAIHLKCIVTDGTPVHLITEYD
jgi:hypothetical protein